MFKSTLLPLLISQRLIWLGSHFTAGVTRRLLLSSRVSLFINLLAIRERVFFNKTTFIQIGNILITNDEPRDDNKNRRVTTYSIVKSTTVKAST